MNHGWQNEALMDRKVVGVVFFEAVTMVALVTRSVTSPQLLDVVWRSAAVVSWSCSCGGVTSVVYVV